MVYSLTGKFVLMTLFSTVHDITTSTIILKHDVFKISKWTVQSKIDFNSDPFKQAKKLLFSKKKSSKPYPTLYFNENPIYQVQLQSA